MVRRFIGAAACAAACVLALAGPASAGEGGGDGGDRAERVEVEVAGVCGRRSQARLRLRAEDGRVRVDARVRTSAAGAWRLLVLHERRIVARRTARSTRSSRGFEVRVVLPDYAGADVVTVRASGPGGENCTATATAAEPRS